jgi:putative ABC transport system substrate-binding protein
MKKIILLVTGISLVLGFYGCGGGSNVIGISKIVSHPALDGTEKGIQDELKALGYNFKFDLQNANGDANAAKTIANKFMTNRVKIAVGIATPTSQALAGTISDIPVVFTAVTDPVEAGLVKTLEADGRNITGISDMIPVKAQIEFLLSLKPVKVLAHIYTSSEKNAVLLAELAKKACAELNIEFAASAVTKSAEVKQAAQLLAGKVDAFYVTTDNTVVSALSAIAEIAADKKIPIMSADPASAENIPVLAAWGFDYYKMGRATGKMIDEILKGRNPGTIPTRFMTDPKDIDLLINLDVAKDLGITIPNEVVGKASKLIRDGKLSTVQS